MNSIGVLFDMDGVLIDSNPFHKIALQQFCKKHGFDLNEDQLRKTIYGRTNRAWITNLFGTLSEEQLEVYAEEKEALFRELYKSDIKPLEGLRTFLDSLKEANIPYAIATSAPRKNVDFTLEKCNLQDYFEIILDDSFVTNGKPDPEIYLKSAAAINLNPARCIVFEDSIAGVTSGLAAGCKVVGVATTHSPEELNNTSIVIKDFTGLQVSTLRGLL